MSAEEQLTWIDTAAGQAAAVRLHRPAGARASRALVIVPPFGWEDMCSYRPRRSLAVRLADAGLTVARLELPGGGDAEGGPWDDDRLEAWVSAVTAAAALVGAQDGVERVAAFGIGLGGLLAWLSAAAGAPVDDLALWGTAAKGRALTRELRALSLLESGASRLPDGALAVGGFVLSGATRAALDAVDLARVGLPDAAERRILLLGRDGQQPDPELVAAAEAGGACVEQGPGEGYGEMLREPQWAAEPRETGARLHAWLTADAPRSLRANPHPPAARTTLELGTTTEREIALDGPRGTLPAVVSEPADASADRRVVLLNPGPQRHTGPNRLWVEAARRWAPDGVSVARVDLGGIGDARTPDLDNAEVAALYAPEYVQEAEAVLAGLDDGRPVLVAGLCSGGYWGLYAAREGARADALVLLNPRTLLWSQQSYELKDSRNLLRQMRDPATWRKVVRGQVDPRRPVRLARAVLRHLLDRLRGRRPAPADPLGPLLALADRGTRLTLVFTGREELADELDAQGDLERLAAHPHVEVHRLGDPTVDAHTMRPPALQREVSAILDAAVRAL